MAAVIQLESFLSLSSIWNNIFTTTDCYMKLPFSVGEVLPLFNRFCGRNAAQLQPPVVEAKVAELRFKSDSNSAFTAFRLRFRIVGENSIFISLHISSGAVETCAHSKWSQPLAFYALNIFTIGIYWMELWRVLGCTCIAAYLHPVNHAVKCRLHYSIFHTANELYCRMKLFLLLKIPMITPGSNGQHYLCTTQGGNYGTNHFTQYHITDTFPCGQPAIVPCLPTPSNNPQCLDTADGQYALLHSHPWQVRWMSHG